MRRTSLPFRAVCVSLLVLGACQDVPTAVVSAPRAPQAAPSNSAGQHLGQVPFYCVEGRRAPSAGGWQTRLDTLFFPRAELDEGGRKVRFQYRRSTAGGNLLHAGDCEVPYTEAALRRVDRFFGIQKDGAAEQFRERQGMITTQGCVTDNGCLLDPLVVVAPPPEIPPCDACNYYPGGGGYGGSGGGGDWGGTGGGEDKSAYEEGPLLWGTCVLALVGSTYSIWQVADKFESWYRAYKDAEGAERLWQATVENNADPYIQQLYEYQYKQAHQRQVDAAGVVGEATRTSYSALLAAGFACGATVLLPTP